MTPSIVAAESLSPEEQESDTPIDKAQRRIGRSIAAALIASTPLIAGGPIQTDRNLSLDDETEIHLVNTEDTRFLAFAPLEVENRDTEESEAERANRGRLDLLAREYIEGQFPRREEQARLDMLTERVRQLIPSVTPADYEALEEAIEQVRRMEADSNERRERRGVA